MCIRDSYYINDQMLAYLGYTYHEFITCIDNKTINCIHPDDRERVLESVQNICEENKTYEIQYRMIKKDGQAIWVYDIGKKEVAEDGRIVCMSVIRDVTVEVEAREKLLEQMAAQEYQSKWYNHLFEDVYKRQG